MFKLVRERLDTAPDDVPLRLFLARKLVDEQQFDAARRQFDEVLKREPGHTDALYARGLLALQMGDYTQAEASFKQLIAQKRRVNEARYYLGQAAELQEKFDLALDYYAMIERGDQYVNARIRAAGILAKQGGLAAGREHLQNTRADNLDTELQLYLAEGICCSTPVSTRRPTGSITSPWSRCPITANCSMPGRWLPKNSTGWTRRSPICSAS